jgi:hypothetical protein
MYSLNSSRHVIVPPFLPISLRAYQTLVTNQLQQLYREVDVTEEWAAMSGEPGVYSPRLDIAVGPFATSRTYMEEYDHLMQASRLFIETILAMHRQNVGNDFEERLLTFEQIQNKNRNSRCLLGIEIENQVSRKHLMGGAINAAALSRIGIGVAWNMRGLRAFVNLRKYLKFLAHVEKNTFDTTNLLILGSDQLLQALNIVLYTDRNN